VRIYNNREQKKTVGALEFKNLLLNKQQKEKRSGRRSKKSEI